MKEYTIDNFDARSFATPIEKTGHYYADHLEINTSSILTRLIQEAGRWCERFASDIVLEWNFAYRDMCQLKPGETESRLLGFRESGVDGTDFVLLQFGMDDAKASHYYRKLYRFDMTREQDDLRLCLVEVDTY